MAKQAMKLSAKLYGGFAITAILFFALGCFSLYSFGRIDRQVGTIYDDRIVPLQQLKLISDDYAIFVIDAVNKTNAGMWRKEEAYRAIDEAQVRIDEHWRTYKLTQLTPEEDKLAEEVEVFFSQADVEIEKLKAVLQTPTQSSLDRFDGPLYKVIDPLTAKLQELINLQLRVAQQEREKAARVYQNTQTLFIILFILALMMMSPIGFLLSQSIVSTLKKTINTLAFASSQIAAAAEEHERIVAQQASSVHQTTTAMAELSASSHKSAERAATVASGAQQALIRAREGSQAVRCALEHISILQEKVTALAEQILHLSEQTNQIGNISGLVSNLANQTNMLALNAAVEAVRFEEGKKGFGVVASEIRKLADRSRQSAQKINVLVADIQTAINSTIRVTSESNFTVKEGIKTVQEMAEAFKELADDANSGAATTREIFLMANQQLAAIEQVMETMNILNVAAQETASGISQTKIGTQKLNEIAFGLKTMV